MSDFFDRGKWLAKQMEYHKSSSYNSIFRKQINRGEIWDCDFGYNIGQEKNKKRPVIVVSNNGLNRTGKVIVAPITDAKGKMNKFGLPQHNTAYLLFSDTTNIENWYDPSRTVPQSANQYSFLWKDSIIQCGEMQSVSKARLINKRGNLKSDDLALLKTKINHVFDIL